VETADVPVASADDLGPPPGFENQQPDAADLGPPPGFEDVDPNEDLSFLSAGPDDDFNPSSNPAVWATLDEAGPTTCTFKLDDGGGLSIDRQTLEGAVAGSIPIPMSPDWVSFEWDGVQVDLPRNWFDDLSFLSAGPDDDFNPSSNAPTWATFDEADETTITFGTGSGSLAIDRDLLEGAIAGTVQIPLAQDWVRFEWQGSEVDLPRDWFTDTT
jgi:hypothetical protein